MIPLPAGFLSQPIAHRALHDRAQQRPENSRAAVRAAVEAGYGIEIDVQLSSDNRAMVFHDYALKRLTGRDGTVRQTTASDLSSTVLLDSAQETIPSLTEILEIVDGQVPLLIEIKDQDGAMGPETGPLEAAVAADLRGYTGPVAVMSFNPHAVALMRRLCPDIPRGLTTCAYDADAWPHLPAATRERLRHIPDAQQMACSFVSHDAKDLDAPRVADLRAEGLAILCWTIRSAAEETAARRTAQNITFEGYLPARAS